MVIQAGMLAPGQVPKESVRTVRDRDLRRRFLKRHTASS